MLFPIYVKVSINKLIFYGGKLMNRLRKIIALTIISLIFAVAAPAPFYASTLTVEAHSGRTDSQSGHHDYKNRSGLGSYHYHHGFPAHLHVNGVCPYENGYTDSNSSSTDFNDTYFSNTNNLEDGTIIISDSSYDNAAFNASYYANNHVDVYQICGDNAQSLYNHFITAGMAEGRQSSAQFSILIYKEKNPDLVEVFGDDLIQYYNHFIMAGVNEGRVAK